MRALQIAEIVLAFAMAYPRATRIHLAMDNLNIHCETSFTAAFGLKEGSRIWRRFTIHHTPTHKHGSLLLNQTELEIGISAKQCPGSRSIPDFPALRPKCKAWCHRMNKAATKINWQFDRKAAGKTFGHEKN